MYAIVKTGGKQYRVEPGAEITVEKLAGRAGDKVTLDAICVVDGKNVVAQAEQAASTTVTATIVEQMRGPKETVFKFKKRKNYKKKQGHRQELTRLFIDAVGAEKATTTAQIVEPDTSIDEDADAEEAQAGLEEAARSRAVDELDAPAETAEEASERDEQQTDVEMADIEYEAAPDIPEDDEKDEEANA